MTALLALPRPPPSWVDSVTFAVAAAIILAGAIGVVVARNPVHSALMLVMTLFGVAVLFVLQRTNFLAAVQVIVYAGAIVVLFLFVIMFLGVDREENIAAEPLRGPAPAGRRPGRPRHGRAARCWARCPTGPPGPRRWPGPAPGPQAATWPPSAGRSSPPTCSPSRSPPPCWSSPWSAPWCWPGGRRRPSVGTRSTRRRSTTARPERRRRRRPRRPTPSTESMAAPVSPRRCRPAGTGGQDRGDGGSVG